MLPRPVERVAHGADLAGHGAGIVIVLPGHVGSGQK